MALSTFPVILSSSLWAQSLASASTGNATAAATPIKIAMIEGLSGPFGNTGEVWFREGLVVADIHRAWDEAENCDVLIVIGTSGLVQPAVGIPSMARKAGALVAVVNPHVTPLDKDSHWSLQVPEGTVMPALMTIAQWRG